MYNTTRSPQPGAATSATSATQATPDTTTSLFHYLVVFFDTQAERVKFNFVYRGDSRPPVEIFSDGFTSRGASRDLLSHALPPAATDWFAESGFISTSRSPIVASRFPRDLRNGQGFLYEINPQPEALDVAQRLKPIANIGLIDREEFRLTVQGEQEMAVPRKINPHDIKQVWPVRVIEIEDSRIQFVEHDNPMINPEYQPPKHPVLAAARTAKFLGSVATAVAAYFDIAKVFEAFAEARHQNNPGIFFKETAAVVTAWSSAAALGLSTSKAAGAACAPLGPGAALACAVVGGAAGSAVGYAAGEHGARTALQSPKAEPVSYTPPTRSEYTHPLRPAASAATLAPIVTTPPPAPPPAAPQRDHRAEMIAKMRRSDDERRRQEEFQRMREQAQRARDEQYARDQARRREEETQRQRQQEAERQRRQQEEARRQQEQKHREEKERQWRQMREEEARRQASSRASASNGLFGSGGTASGSQRGSITILYCGPGGTASNSPFGSGRR